MGLLSNMGAGVAQFFARRRTPVQPPAAKVGGVHQEMWFRPPGHWTMDMVDSALDAHERGEFREAGRLADAILADELILSLSSLRTGTMTGLPFHFEPEVPGLQEDWQAMFPITYQEEALYRSLVMGFCLVQDTRTSHQQLPAWMPWASDCVRYDIWRRVWQVWTLDAGLVDITPGDGQWALFEAKFARPWMAGFIRALGPMMILRQSTIFNWANHAQVYATPSRILKAPQRVSEISDVQRAIARLRALVGDSTIVLPEGLSMELLELKGKSTPEIFERLRRAIDESLGIMWVGQSGTIKASGGWGASHTERRVTQQLLERDVQVVAPTCRRQMLAPYDAWKRGTRDLRQVPKPVWDVTPPQDLAAEAQRQRDLSLARYQEAQELKTLSALDFGDGWRVDMPAVCRQRNIPLIQRRVDPPPAPPAPREEVAVAA